MPEEIHEVDGHLEHPTVRYEKTDASLPAVLTLLAIGTVSGAFILGLVYAIFNSYGRQVDLARQSSFPLAPTPARSLPPEPRLEQIDRLAGNREVNVFARQKAKEDALRRYGTADEEGYVQIPIEEAMKHLAGKLPVRKNAPAGPPRDIGLVDAGESNSGRLFRKEPR
jgi:hypothetical protein